jgi:hypothetical protein
MTREEAAYVAGFLDGEGYATVVCKPNRRCYRAQVGFANRDLAVLAWIQRFVGGHIARLSRQKSTHAPAFELKTSSHAALRFFLPQLLPFLRIKRQQVESLLAFLALGKIKRRGIPARANVEDIAVREQFRQKFKAMNKRGPKCAA